MRIGELSRRTGVSVRALRYYDQRELLTPQRGPNDYREYEESSVDRVKEIRALLGLGFSVGAIRVLLPCALKGSGSLRRCQRTQTALSDKLSELDNKADNIYKLRTAVYETLRALIHETADGSDAP